MKGIDVSHWNKVNWDKVKIDFVFIKATEGDQFVDPEFENNAGVGITKGFYHFAHGGDPTKEARHFARTVDGRDGELALDWEIHHEDPVKWCAKFLKEVERQTGKRPYIYMNRNTENKYKWGKLTSYKLWIASYGINNGEIGTPPRLKNWKEWSIWQYTSRGRIKGVKGNVDLNTTKTNWYSQKNPRWGSQQLGTCATSIAGAGCFITSLANLSRTELTDPKGVVREAHPGIVDWVATTRGLYANGCLVRSKQFAEMLGLEYNGKSKHRPDYPCIAETDHYKNKGFRQHFFVIFPNGNIIDPLDKMPEEKPNPYHIVNYRLFKKMDCEELLEKLKKAKKEYLICKNKKL